MSSYFVLGSTGLCGSHFLKAVSESNEVAKVLIVSRREPKISNDESSKVVTIVEPDTAKWSEEIDKVSKENIKTPASATFFSAFGTTRKAAGSAENFIKIDHDINVNSFQAASDSGLYETAILVSSIGSNSQSSFLYPQTKGKIEEAIKKMAFKRTIILRPGILLGSRQEGHGKGFPSNLGEKAGGFFRSIGLNVLSPIYGEEVARVGLFLSLKPVEKEGEVIVVEGGEMLKIVRENGLEKKD